MTRIWHFITLPGFEYSSWIQIRIYARKESRNKKRDFLAFVIYYIVVFFLCIKIYTSRYRMYQFKLLPI